MLYRIALCIFTVMMTAVSTDADGDDESVRLAWAVRKLVGNCSRADYFGRPIYRVGKTGPPGPRGEPGKCECDRLDDRGIQTKLTALEGE